MVTLAMMAAQWPMVIDMGSQSIPGDIPTTQGYIWAELVNSLSLFQSITSNRINNHRDTATN